MNRSFMVIGGICQAPDHIMLDLDQHHPVHRQAAPRPPPRAFRTPSETMTQQRGVPPLLTKSELAPMVDAGALATHRRYRHGSEGRQQQEHRRRPLNLTMTPVDA